MPDHSRLVQLTVQRPEIIDSNGSTAQRSAGNFSGWLRGAEASLRSEAAGVDVNCGACRGCCRSSMFIHIKPEEKETIQRIPRAVLFPAPGLPKGHLLMGYDDKGQCPMFIENVCSIYEHRPQTCRDYDCRIFAATGVPVDGKLQPEIAQRVAEWVFDRETETDRARHTLLQRAAAFLTDNSALFPKRSLPSQPGLLAALAVKILRQSKALTATFEGLSYSKQKEFVDWIEQAKRPETRTNRLDAMLVLLEQGRSPKG